MKKPNIKQLRGAKDLLQEAVEAGVNATEKVHHAIAKKPYAVLGSLPVIAVPVRHIETVQTTITTGVYRAIRAVNKTSGTLATHLIDRLDDKAQK